MYKTYKEMIEEARASGVANERAMYAGIDRVSDLLEMIEDEHPEEYKKFMRHTHESLYGPHYDNDFAREDLSRIHYTDKAGKKHQGPYWTKEEVLEVTRGKNFPQETTDCDKWVAYNAAYADFCKAFEDAQILDIAYLFFFADEDWNGKGKIWKYMNLNN